MRLIVRLPNWVGDVCMALPTLTALAERGVDLHLLGKGWAGGLLAAHGWTHSKMVPGLRPGSALVRSLGIERGLLLTNSFGSAAQFRLGGVRACGYRAECRTLLLARGVPRQRGLHEVESFWRLGQEVAAWLALTPLPPTPPASLGLRLGQGAHDAAAKALERAGVHSAYVLLCPLAAGTIHGQPKIWSGFPLLTRLLLDRGVPVVACPGPGEEVTCAAATPGARQLTGLGLDAYAAVAAGALITVANDSGPMHLAAAVDAPVLGLFGASAPGRTRPWSALGSQMGGLNEWPTVEMVAHSVASHL